MPRSEAFGPPLTNKQLAAVQKWMRTPEFRERVEVARAKWKTSGSFNFSELAKELDLPLRIVLAIFEKTAKDQGIYIHAVGKPH